MHTNLKLAQDSSDYNQAESEKLTAYPNQKGIDTTEKLKETPMF